MGVLIFSYLDASDDKLIVLDKASHYSGSVEPYVSHYVKIPSSGERVNARVDIYSTKAAWVRFFSVRPEINVANLEDLDEASYHNTNFMTIPDASHVRVLVDPKNDTYVEFFNLFYPSEYEITYMYSEKKTVPISILGLTIPILGNVEATPIEYIPKSIFNLKKTGQTKSYTGHYAHTGLTDIKDDGYYQSGITPKYTRDNTTGIVSDEITGLQWQDNRELRTKENLSWIDWVGKDFPYDWTGTTGDTPINYCKNLQLGSHDDWRLPSINELQSIAYYGDYGTGLDPKYFKNFAKSFCVWSNNHYYSKRQTAIGSHFAWRFGEWSGESYGASVGGSRCGTRCVRGAKTVSKGYSIGEDTVYDRNTKLEWQDTEITESRKRASFEEAIAECEALELNGKDDWRLPNINELASIMGGQFDGESISSPFTHTYTDPYVGYISSTGYYDDDTPYEYSIIYNYLTISTHGTINSSWQTGEGTVRCVRGGGKTLVR